MAKAWAKIEFTDANGKHEEGEALDLPRETDAEKAEFDRLKEYGIITTTEPKTAKSDPASGRTGRNRD